MLRSFRLAIALALFVAAQAASGLLREADAQGVLRIAAVVNDEVVSAQDLDQRLDLAIAATGQPNTPELRQRLRDQVLRSLIDERLQSQEAERLKLTAQPEEIQQTVRQLELQNNIPEGRFDEFLQRQGISMRALTQQLRTDILWSKVVRRRVVPTVTISDDEVNLAIEQLKRDVGAIETLVAEIMLLVDNPDQEEEVRRNAVRITEQLKAGANFPAMARQFSKGQSASAGGDLGWIRAGTLPEEVDAAISKMQPGQLSDPIRSTAGYHIILLRERRQVRLADPANATVTMKQISFALPQRASRAEADATISLARALYDSVVGCPDLDRAASELGIKTVEVANKKIGELPPRIRPVAAELDVGKLSTPLPGDGGIGMYMVCERKEASGEPDREQIRTRLANARIEQGARRLLRDLRRDAVVELR